MMKYVFVLLLGIVFVAGPAWAADEFVVEKAYDPMRLTSSQVAGSLWLGDLSGYPHLYEFALAATTTVRLELRAVDHQSETPAFAGILVRDRSNRGVQELVRLSKTDQWSLEQSNRTRMNYLVRRPFESTLGPGEYRFEVSTPDNQGRYVLQFGAGDTGSGYFASLADIRQIQAFHGYSWWHLFRTTHVYAPFLLLGILLGIAYTWHYARRRKIL